ncbi:MAG TPA: DUF4396 domain-containing protein [Streptosporangiaceae bacterium]|nr:DUF4396 domain-containing protein [Streptosporangiaceae bacterium]
MAPGWLTAVAWTYLSVCFLCAAIVGYDIFVCGRRQSMGVMNAVYPITALYFGPLALAVYWRWRRAPSRRAPGAGSGSLAHAPQTAMARTGEAPGTDAGQHGAHGVAETPERPAADRQAKAGQPRWLMMATEVSHCGSGCALGDVISEFAIFWLALSIAGVTLWAEYIGDYFFALAFGIVFQYFAIAPMRGLGVRDGLKAAAKADFISLTAFEVGLFGWMAVMAFVLFPAPNNLTPGSAAFWFLMQVGMMIGFFASWPANVWLVRRGIKIPM